MIDIDRIAYVQFSEPTLPQISAVDAVVSALSPIRYFLSRALSATADAARDSVQTISPRLVTLTQSLSAQALELAADALTASLNFLVLSTGSAYNSINDRLIEFVDADIEMQAEASPSSSSSSQQVDGTLPRNSGLGDFSAAVEADKAGQFTEVSPPLAVGITEGISAEVASDSIIGNNKEDIRRIAEQT